MQSARTSGTRPSRLGIASSQNRDVSLDRGAFGVSASLAKMPRAWRQWMAFLEKNVESGGDWGRSSCLREKWRDEFECVVFFDVLKKRGKGKERTGDAVVSLLDFDLLPSEIVACSGLPGHTHCTRYFFYQLSFRIV